jgi:UDP-N-acetylmuramate--alanine ligase
MHIYFSGIGGAAIGPLALLAKQAGYEVSGSDARDSTYISTLKAQGITDITIGQSADQISKAHLTKPIDWFIYTSALNAEANHPELTFAKQQGIKTSKRDELLNEIISRKQLKLVAVAGTHGKSTTTAMAIWAMQQLNLPISFSVGAKIGFGDMGHYEHGSQYFIYEADEFDRNFLAFHPFYSIITGLSWDHHEIFHTQEDYNQAFNDFLDQSQRAILWSQDLQKLGLDSNNDKFTIADENEELLNKLTLIGQYNRADAWLVVKSISQITGETLERLVEVMNRFPGLSRRFEKITNNLYSDYAHTPEKIVGCMSVARELAGPKHQKIVVIYEPLTNRRMHYLAQAHRDVFEGASKIYWVPSYLAREDPNLPVLTPAELIKNLSTDMQAVAHPAELNDELKNKIKEHLEAGDLVVAMSGGATLDEWVRKNFT